MRGVLKWMALVLIIPLVLFTGPAPDSNGQVKPQAGGRLIHGSSQEPDTLNMLLSNMIVSWEVASVVFSRLTRIDNNGEIVPDLAVEVPTLENGGISRDGLAYTYRLHPGVRWHDGAPLTSNDVKFTWETIMNPKVNVRSRAGFDRVATVETPDEATVVFRLRQVYPPFAELWSYAAILPRHLLEGKDINTDKFNRVPVGSGPFKLKEWVAGSHITLVKNETYFKRGLPYLDTVIYKFVPDTNVLLNQLETGEVDTRFWMPTEQAPLVQKMPQLVFQRTPLASHFLLMMNLNNPIFKDVKVRRALAHGFDKEVIAQKILGNLVDPAWSPIHPKSWAYNPELVKLRFDPGKAKQLLAEAGWKDTDGDGVLDKDGQRLSFEISNVAGDPERIQILQFIQRQWKEIGVDARIRNVDVATMFGSVLPKRQHQMNYSFWSTDLDPDLTEVYRTGQPRNFTAYSNPQVDRLLEDGVSTVDISRRKKAYLEFQNIVESEVPALRIFWRQSFDAWKKKLHNVKPNPSQRATNFWNAEEWWIER